MSRIENLVGRKFGRLTVVKRVYRDSPQTYWECKCDCGKIVYASSWNLKNGNVKSCGCIKLDNLIGKKFGKLTVIERSEDEFTKSGHKKIMWKCKCDCGRTHVVPSSSLRNGNVRSCGKCGTRGAKGVVDNTNIYYISSKKVRKDNKTGVRGVIYKSKNGQYIANITFKKQQYYLGCYRTLEEAANARKEAEEKMFGDFIKWYSVTHKESWERIQKKREKSKLQ